MANAPAATTVQVVNVDLAVERQKILREKLREYFRGINAKSKVRKEIVYTLNAENTPLESVLRANMTADSLFTGFNYDAETSNEFKQELLVETSADTLKVDPQLRYPVIAEFRRLMDRGLFRHRKLILVGDVYARLRQAVKSGLPVQVSVYTNAERTQVSPPLPIASIDRLSDGEEGGATTDKIAVGQIHAVRIAEILFDGIINMPERGNRFELKDQTVLDTTRKLFTMEGVREVMTREHLREEKLTFVRGKKVFIVLDPDLDHVIADRLIFDKMQQLHRHHTMEEALHTLSTGKSQGIVDYFESEGYDLVFDVLSQEERDTLLLGVLGNELWGFLERELASQKGNLAVLEDGEIQQLLHKVPEPVLNQTLDALKDQAYEKFLALVPVKIRENVILDFLSRPESVRTAWKGIGEPEKKEILAAQATQILSHLMLTRSALFRQKFPMVKFEFERNYDSASLGKMGKEEREATFALFARSIEQARLPAGIVAKQLLPAEIDVTMTGLILSRPAEFYNRLNPLVRKQLWVTTGRESKEHITRSLHFLDKVEILLGSKEAALTLLFSNGEFLTSLRHGRLQELAGLLFLTLKKTNKAESKNALLKRLLTAPEWKERRVKGVPAVLSHPEHAGMYAKLADRVETLEFAFDSLICTRVDYELLKDKPPLAHAVVTLVDELVDASLLHLFQKTDLSKEEYDQFSHSVEEQIARLRARMAERETEDPVGVYVLESMQVINEMSNQAMLGKLDAEMAKRIDARRAIRQRLVETLRQNLRAIEEFLQKAGAQTEQFDEKIKSAQKLSEQTVQAFDEAFGRAKAAMAEFQKLQQLQAKANADKKTVALTQKQLSLQFFDLVQPLILDSVRRLENPLRKVLRALGLLRRKETESQARRVIFKFTDEEIENILRFKILFCTKDEILMQFILTCLRIDNLQDSLFALAKFENLPAHIDILFYGPGHVAADFAGLVAERRIVPFADEAFYKRLLANERLKAATKQTLVRTGQESVTRRQQIEVLNREVAEKQAKVRQVEQALATLQAEKVKLAERIAQQKEREHRLRGEGELLEGRFAEVDGRFQQVQERINATLAKGAGATALAADRTALGEGLRDELLALNKELARMMFIKGVKDAGGQISQTTQQGILAKIEARETFHVKQHPLKKVIVADDGSPNGRNLKRVFINVAALYFKLSEMAFEDITVKRLEGRAEAANTKEYPLIAVMTDAPGDSFGELRRVVKKVRTTMPESFQLVFTPLGEIWNADPGSELFKNVRSLKENSALVNTALHDVTTPNSMLRLLQERAPLN